MASPAEAAQSRIGRRVAGKYQLTRLLGVGGMGAVYEADHTITGRRVAVKVLHEELAERKGFAKRFLREAQSAGQIGHPGIIDVLDAGTDNDGTLYLVLELLSGEDLHAALVRGVVDVALLVRVARELLGALEAAHARGIVHRDLKPENVFLARTPDGGRVKLLDFGIAKQVGGENLRLTTTGTVLGTPYYMSPEQARGKEVDARSDLWSLGAVLFDALAGRPPLQGENYNELIAAILTEPFPSVGVLRPDLPPGLVAVVDQALVRDRDARWQSATAMRAALETIPAASLAGLRAAPRLVGIGTSESGVREHGLGDETPILTRPGAAATSVDRPWRRPQLVGAAAVIGVLVLSAIGVGIFLATHRTPPVTAAPLAHPTAPAALPVAPTPPTTPVVLTPLTPSTPPGDSVAMPPTHPSRPTRPVRPHPVSTHRPTDPIREYVPH